MNKSSIFKVFFLCSRNSILNAKSQDNYLNYFYCFWV
nr:MAG TPA: hypothetical protein [Caudoviricetes sp.]